MVADPHAEPPWLDDDEMRTWLALVTVLIRLPATLDAQLRRDAEMTHFDYQILAMLSAADGLSMRMSDVARLTDSSLSRLSHGARRLEDRGWIRRTVDPADGRSTIATLTPAGAGKLAATAPGHVATVRRHVFDPITDRQADQLRLILTRIAASIDADTDTDPAAGGTAAGTTDNATTAPTRT